MAKHCPQCKQLYRDAFDACADCKVPLAEGLPPIETPPETKAPDKDEGPAWAVLAKSNDPFRLELMKNRLEEEGIEAVLTDQEIVAMDWLLSNAVGGVKLMVSKKDAEQAARILREMEAGKEKGEGAPEAENGEIRCPACGSDQASEKPAVRLTWFLLFAGLFTGGVAFLIAGLYWLATRRMPPVMVCGNCGNTWVPEDESRPR